MKQKRYLFAVLAVLCLALTACTQAAPSEEEPALPYENITFQAGQLYAAAYLGWEEMTDLDFYRETYLRGADVPIHYISPGEFYLIIPRYPDMAVKLYQNDINGAAPVLLFEAENCVPFVVQCNISDIFSDLTVELSYGGEAVSFSPYISLKDGSVQVGERGLELKKTA